MWYKQQTVGIRPKDLETTISKFYNYTEYVLIGTTSGTIGSGIQTMHVNNKCGVVCEHNCCVG